MPAWLFASLRDYRAAWLRGDVVAGLTVWAVHIPESLAFASIAGVPRVVGLYVFRARVTSASNAFPTERTAKAPKISVKP